MTFTQRQRDSMASTIRDVADAMVDLSSMASDVSELWIAGGWSQSDLDELTGNNADITAADLVNMVVTLQAYLTWYSANADTNAAKVHRYG